MTEKVCIGCLLALCALLVMRSYKPEWAPLLRTAATICFAAAALSMTGQLLRDTVSLFGSALPEDTWLLMIKALGLCLLTECAAGICRDSGEPSLGSWVENMGRLELIVTSMPLVRNVLETVSTLLSAGG